MAFPSILVSLCSRNFSNSLIKKLVESLTKLLAWFTKFINIEEVKFAKKKRKEKGQKAKQLPKDDN